MTSTPRRRPAKADEPFVDRRVPEDARGPIRWLRWLRGLFTRPIRIRRIDGRLHLVQPERRRARPSPLDRQREEVRLRVLSHGAQHAGRSMRHLMYVHDELGRKGWAGVEALPLRVIAKAVVQAETLVREDPGATLPAIADRLRLILVAAEHQASAAGRPAPASDVPDTDFQPGLNVDVSESTHEDFEEMERSWVGTLPPGVLAAREQARRAETT